MYEGAIAGATSRHTDSCCGFQVPQFGRPAITSHLRFTPKLVTKGLPQAVFATACGAGLSQVDCKRAIAGAIQRCGEARGNSVKVGLKRCLAEIDVFSKNSLKAKTMRSRRSSGAPRSSDSGGFRFRSLFRYSKACKAAKALVGKTVSVASSTDRERDRVVSVGRAGPMTNKLPIIKMTKRRDEMRGTARHV